VVHLPSVADLTSLFFSLVTLICEGFPTKKDVPPFSAHFPFSLVISVRRFDGEFFDVHQERMDHAPTIVLFLCFLLNEILSVHPHRNL